MSGKVALIISDFCYPSKSKLLAVYLTIESVEASPDKLVVVSDFVDNSSKTAHTVLDHLETERRTIRSSL